MSDIFISYAREDHPSARRLAEALEVLGWTVWWDHSLMPGESFRKTIEGRLKEAKAVIVLWSEHSVDSSFVLDEASRALRRNVLAPIVVDGLDAHSFPLGFGDLHAEDLSGWTGEPEHEGFRKLLELLTSRIGARPQPQAEVDPRDSEPFEDSTLSEQLVQPPRTRSKPQGRGASPPGRAVLEFVERDHSKLLQGTYAFASLVGAALFFLGLWAGQDWNLWLAFAVPSFSWGVVGFKWARRSLAGAALLALMSFVLGVIIFVTVPG